MAIGAVIHAHTHLQRTEQLARALAKSGTKVAIHVDKSVPQHLIEPLQTALENRSNIIFTNRITCDWGRFSLVEAGLGAATELLARWPGVSHVLQISGACLPVKPLKELKAFLKARPGEDFVESVALDEDWVQGGLGHERFSLYFPFSWKRQRLLFDAWVEVQRALRINRKSPNGLTPHLGSQWWCLSRDTLTAILNDPERPTFDRYFTKCWIPDESYVPTLARRHSKSLVSKSLTLTRFDDQGKPHMFYDDHAELLRRSDHFFARKIWHGADGLYREFLGRKKARSTSDLNSELGLDLVFQTARARRCSARKGLRNAGSFPNPATEKRPSTVGPYHAFLGLGQVLEGFDDWLSNHAGLVSYGRAFHAGRVGSTPADAVYPGCISANPKIRDMAPEQYLCNLLWANQEKAHALSIELADGARIASFLAYDPNARLVLVEGSWLLDLYHRDHTDPKILKQQALRLSQEDRVLRKELRAAGSASKCRRVGLSELLEDPEPLLSAIGHELGVSTEHELALPAYRDLSGFRAFLDRLQGLGVDTSAIGALPNALPGEEIETVALRQAS